MLQNREVVFEMCFYQLCRLITPSISIKTRKIKKMRIAVNSNFYRIVRYRFQLFSNLLL